MTDTDTRLLQALASSLAVELAGTSADELRTAARRLADTDPGAASLAGTLADLAEDLDAIDDDRPIPTRGPEPVRLTMADQLTLVTDNGHLDGRTRQVWVGGVDVTLAIPNGGVRFDTLAGERMEATVTLALLGPIEITRAEEVQA